MAEGDEDDENRLLVVEAVEDYFMPEFINRIDEIIVFVSMPISLYPSVTHLSNRNVSER